MNPGNIASNVASKTASNTAENVASNTVNNVANNAAKGTTLPPLTQNSQNNITSNSSNSPQDNNGGNIKNSHNNNLPNPRENNNDNNDNNDNLNSHKNSENVNNNEEQHSQRKIQDENVYQAQSNQNVGAGKKIDENGNVVNTGSRKAIEAIGRGAAAYATGGESIGKENIITKSAIGDKTLGVVSDLADKTPIAGKVLNDLGDSGLADGVNDALDTVGNIKNGNIKETIDSAKKTVKDVDKAVKHYSKKIIFIAVAAFLPLLLVIAMVIIICGPSIGGFLNITNSLVGNTGDDSPSVTNPSDNLSQNLTSTEQLLSAIPNYNGLSPIRKGVLAAAASGIASGRPYHIHRGENDPCLGKPTGPGLNGIPMCGIDCSGFVQWSLWTATGNKPFSGGTANMVNNIGGIFEEISASELQPGDIGLKHKNSGSNHTGIYAGNGMWFHAANSKAGIIKSKYSGFTVFLRYKGVDA